MIDRLLTRSSRSSSSVADENQKNQRGRTETTRQNQVDHGGAEAVLQRPANSTIDCHDSFVAQRTRSSTARISKRSGNSSTADAV